MKSQRSHIFLGVRANQSLKSRLWRDGTDLSAEAERRRKALTDPN